MITATRTRDQLPSDLNLKGTEMAKRGLGKALGELVQSQMGNLQSEARVRNAIRTDRGTAAQSIPTLTEEGDMREPWKRSKESDDQAMSLPEGKTCADCHHVEGCAWLISVNPANEVCDWGPSKFREKPKP